MAGGWEPVTWRELRVVGEVRYLGGGEKVNVDFETYSRYL